MQEEGKLHRLKTKWWKEVDGGNCEADVETASDGAAELGIGNVGGVFVVLVLGCLCASILGIVEFLWNVKDLAIEEKVKYLRISSDSHSRSLIFHFIDFLVGRPENGATFCAQF